MKQLLFILAALFFILSGSCARADDVYNYCRSYYRDYDENKRCQTEQAEAKKMLESGAFPREISRQCIDSSYVSSRRVFKDYVAARQCAAEETLRRQEESSSRKTYRSKGGY